MPKPKRGPAVLDCGNAHQEEEQKGFQVEKSISQEIQRETRLEEKEREKADGEEAQLCQESCAEATRP